MNEETKQWKLETNRRLKDSQSSLRVYNKYAHTFLLIYFLFTGIFGTAFVFYVKTSSAIHIDLFPDKKNSTLESLTIDSMSEEEVSFQGKLKYGNETVKINVGVEGMDRVQIAKLAKEILEAGG